jgi:nucleoside-diphosphate kinase
MTSGPVIIKILEGENAVNKYRKLIGDTDPKKASSGTIRHDFATSIQANVVHGSDSFQSAMKEIHFFFGN